VFVRGAGAGKAEEEKGARLRERCVRKRGAGRVKPVRELNPQERKGAQRAKAERAEGAGLLAPAWRSRGDREPHSLMAHGRPGSHEVKVMP